MTDQERLAYLRNRILEAGLQATLLPINVVTLKGGPIAPGTAVAMPVPAWDAIIEALDAE